VKVWLELGRFHIVAIAALAAAVFGWLFDGRLGLLAGALVGADWFLLNLWNRIADVPEDFRNGIDGTDFVAAHARALSIGAWAVLAASLLLPLGWPLFALRLAFHAGGFVYSFRVRGVRLKEIFVVKNVFSGLLFIASVIGYPLALGAAQLPAAEVLALAAFFLPLEITYELIYDLRDFDGDRAEGIVTVPVAWGAARTRALIRALIAASAIALAGGYLGGALGWRELVMIAAPLQQALVLRFWIPAAVTKRDAVRITYLGAAQLASYALWVAAGLPLERPW
jgi:4-hydroxybenzoate polyprenyltransferase